MASKQDNIQFLKAYLKRLIKAYNAFWNLLPCDLIEPPTRREIIDQLSDYAKSASIRAEEVKNQIQAGHLRKCADLLANRVFRSEHADRIIARREKIEERRLVKVERVARLADEYGFDGSLFRNLTPDDDPLSLQEGRKLRRQIETIPKIIAAIERDIDKSIIPEGAELITISQLARMMQMGESVIRDKNKKGLIPMPVSFSGNLMWVKEEIDSWFSMGCLSRQEWELKKQE